MKLPDGTTIVEDLAATSTSGAVPSLAATPVVRFIGGASRSTVIPLDYPVEYAGVEYREMTLRRLTTDEVAEFLKSVQGQPEDAKVTFPIFRTADDKPVPDEVLSALDDDDMTTLNEAAQSFLPRRFRAPPDSGSIPPAGEPTAP